VPDLGHIVEPEEIMAYLDGELPSARAAAAMNHLERCAECRNLAADLRRQSHARTSLRSGSVRSVRRHRSSRLRDFARPQRTVAGGPTLFRQAAAVGFRKV
jgi:anti-sigma factor RsiW